MRPIAAALMMTAACSGGGPDAPDSATADAADAGAADAALPPEPAAAALPILTPCPSGWQERTLPSGVITCDPFPGGGPARCPPGEARFPGAGGCAAVGSPCPAGEWPDDLAEAGVLHVRDGASPGGDGSRSTPFDTIGAALAAAAPGVTVVVARGHYDEELILDDDILLRGVCPAGTVLTRSERSTIRGVVTLQFGATGRLSDVSIVSASRAGIFVNSTASLTLRGVVIDSVEDVGIWTAGRVSGGNVLVRGTRPAPAGASGQGLSVTPGASLDLEQVVVEDSAEYAVLAAGGTLVLRDALLQNDPATVTPSTPAAGLLLIGSESVLLERVVVDGSNDLGLSVTDRGGTVVVRDLLVRDTRPLPDTAGGYGIAVDAAEVELSRVHVERSGRAGIIAASEASLLLADVVVEATGAGVTVAQSGRGIELGAGADAVLQRVALLGNREYALLADGSGTTVEARDLVVLDTDSGVGGTLGRALQVQVGATAAIGRARFERNREVSAVASAGGRIELEDLVVRETLPRACAETTCAGFGAGTAVAALLDGYARITRFALADNALCGIQLARGGTADLATGVISGNLVGANVQTPGFDVERLEQDVVYRDNVRDLVTDELPVPDP